jgi:hypothetical protein
MTSSLRRLLGSSLIVVGGFTAAWMWNHRTDSDPTKAPGFTAQQAHQLAREPESTDRPVPPLGRAPSSLQPLAERSDFRSEDLHGVPDQTLQKLAPLKGSATWLAYYGLAVAEMTETSAKHRELQARLLRYLKAHPEEMLLLTRESLRLLPAVPEFAVERNGLLVAAALTSPPDFVRPLLEAELSNFAVSNRPSMRGDMTESELSQALSSGFDHEHLRQIFLIWAQGWQSQTPDVGRVVRFMSRTNDLLLRREFYTIFAQRSPNHRDQLDEQIRAAGLPLDQIRTSFDMTL